MAIDEVVERLWLGREIRISPIAAGLTNQNFRVQVDGVPYFVRIPGESTDLLAVDRVNELHNTRAAAEAGVGPKVVAHDPSSGALVLAWIDGRTMSNAAFADAGTPARIAEALRKLHAGPRFRDDFNMFRLTDYYLRVVDERSIRDPRRLPRGAAEGRADRGRAGRPPDGDGPVPQRPAGRELPRRRPAALDRRLRVQRQQRPDVRARQHRPGARIRRRAPGGALRRVLRRGHRRRSSPGCGSR